VEMPWAERAGAVLMAWYPGEEGADALADMVVGVSEPTGRLPVTFPARTDDGPTGSDKRLYPGVNGQVFYEEGRLVGYRYYETAGVAPAFCFGHGLSYGDVMYDEVDVTAERVRVRLVNKGQRRGTAVVQIYVRALDSPVERPDRELAGFVKVAVDPGVPETVERELDAAAFRYWDVESEGWKDSPGRYEVLVGASSRDIRATVPIVRETA